MTSTSTNDIQSQLAFILSQLPQKQQKQVLDFAMSLNQKSLTQKWDHISDEEAAKLQAEFANEDVEFSELILSNYLSELEQEDIGLPVQL